MRSPQLSHPAVVSALFLIVSLSVGCNDGRSATEGDDVILIGDADGKDDGGLDGGTDSADDAVDDAVDDGSDSAIDADPDAMVDAGSRCGDGVVDEGEECDDGVDNSDLLPDACREDCSAPSCGDAVTDADEGCDDGVDNSDLLPDACREDCTPAACGDGVTDSMESCDDGNDDDGDSCSNSCRFYLASLCSPCESDDTCGRARDLCVGLDEGSFCAIECGDDDACPDFFVCRSVTTDGDEPARQCVAESGICEPCLDPDGDGFGIGPECAGYDCNEGDPSIFAGAAELCDGLDNDCDGAIDEPGAIDGVPFFRDADEDGFGADGDSLIACAPSGQYTADRGGDCDDSAGTTFPGAPERCDGVDNDCDGVIDNDAGDVWFRDADGDTFGDDDETAISCEPPPGLWADRGGDCDDGEPLAFPGAEDICDGIDNDCSGEVDDDSTFFVSAWPDHDEDTFGDASSGVWECFPPEDYVSNDDDCDDSEPGVNPEAREVCGDGLDNDCAGGADCVDAACADDISCVDVDCIDGDLGRVIGTDVASGSNTAASDSRRGSCAGNGRELEFMWTAPASGTAVIDTLGSNYDTVLYVLEGSCGGDQIVCNDDGFSGGDRQRSRVTFDAIEGTRYVIVLDSFENGSLGNYRLNIEFDIDEDCENGEDDDGDGDVDCFDSECGVSDACAGLGCPEDDLSDDLGEVATGDTDDGRYAFAPSCGDASAPDLAFAWTAPSTGDFLFAVDADFDASVAIYAGCEGEELGCSGGELRASFEAGDEVIIVVDGADAGESGDFELNIRTVETACANERDDDGDGDVDCADSDCAGTDACVEICDDERDNDGDDAIDCADSDCELGEICCPSDIFEPNEGTAFAPSTVWDVYRADRDATLTVRSGNVDSFRLPACNGAVIRAQARFSHAAGNIDLRLVRFSGSNYVVANSTTDNEALEFTVRENTDRTFLQAYMVEDATCNSYTLNIEVDTTGCAP